MSDAAHKIAFQGFPGAYSHMACQAVKPDMEPVPCASFETMLTEVQEGRANLAMVPVENSTAGRVADIHHLLPSSGLYIIGEHFHRVNHHIMAPRGATLDGLTHVHSHAQGLAQCRERIRKLGLTPVMHPDTAGAAKDVGAAGDPTVGAIASRLAAEIYDLDILFESAEDDEHNTTRFLLMSATPELPERGGAMMTTLVFQLRSVPAALYKALGGFATNGINLTKLESYIRAGVAEQAQFYMDVQAHIDDPAMQNAMEELCFYCTKDEVHVLGTYPASPARA
ncbi:MAG: prephenate dehydratase [Proteobacteria bacterium]|nr:prephenate dehydratase [Pseudomonadota bacterium]MDA0960806.1 prephenate dehydratase [Pseudomonadota bacterium]MDA1152157.1 prephenate dehydratase [Pseudomonadota bacterium]